MRKKLRSILLIDDDEPTNFLNEMVLKKVDCAEEILVFQSAEKAVDFLNASTIVPDLIFLDINMPAMNGWDFLEAYQQLPAEKRKAVIVMLTTSINPDDRVKARQIAAVAGFKHKPLTREIVEEVLTDYFNE